MSLITSGSVARTSAIDRLREPSLAKNSKTHVQDLECNKEKPHEKLRNHNIW